ncbi:DUF4062 domain-containing protein [Glaciihabitans sp. dw_435]|uniref:DUF4062 domain-containing protein n=1 Tax=Glaciihabitans sp. dw_435 TaxID=2720081 RepID=UPI001BD4C1BB|nr:DUF4062 domain-containing protein [Glaciihabitans sp. dw_435]
MDSPPSSIRTPDQRLRVFVSSTLRELADERKAARVAIEKLHLAPVMFELGARPHPPRDLYRAYLDQSDVFIGLYWDRYGWVAPGEAVSGLEDEYNLAPELPKLIYIKEPSQAREPRLTELLNRIRADDTASFKYFSTADELAQLMEADLATLLAERFDQSRRSPTPVPADRPRASAPQRVPAPLTELVGREHESLAVQELLRRDAVRLLTLTGPGGIGKSRLAIDVATRMTADFPDGIFFIDLSSLHDAALVPVTIATALGVQDTGSQDLPEKIALALRGCRSLLVIDNFEQVLDATPTLIGLLQSSPGVKLLVTSRSILRVSAERNFEVGPLALPAAEASITVEEAARIPCIELFVQRAHAVKPDFELTADNAAAVARICIGLDGVPLALELAAARTRVLTPQAMLARLDRRLPLLAGGGRDLPERQQTLRGTIQWSTDLLTEQERSLLATLGVFEGGFTLEAAEQVSGDSDDTITLLGALVDSSLVREQDRSGTSWFTMLSTVAEHAREQLDASGRGDKVRARHCRYFVTLGAHVEFALEGAEQRAWLAQLSLDHDNIRAGMRYLLDRRDWDTAADFAWTLYLFWWVGGHLGEVRSLMEELLTAGGEALSGRARAIALYFTCAIGFWQDPDGRILPGLTESAALFHADEDAPGEALALVSVALALLTERPPRPGEADDALESALGLFRSARDRWGEALALITLGRVALLQQKAHAALNRFEESLELTLAQGDQLGEEIAYHHLGWTQLVLGETVKAAADFDACLRLALRLGHAEGVAYGLEGFVGLAAAAGDIHRTGVLFGATQRLRERGGLFNAPAFSFHEQYIDALPGGAASPEFVEARAEGHTMDADDAVSLALSVGVTP